MERPISLQSVAAELPPGLSRSRQRRRKRWWTARVPWTIYGYVVGEVLQAFLLGVLAISLLHATLAAYQTVRSGLQLSFVWPLVASTLAYPLYFSIPISLLFAVTLVVGRMVNDLEVTAFRTHGISHIHVYAPVLALGLGLAGLSFYLNGWVIPRVHYERRNLQAYVLKQIENLGSGVNRTIMLPDGDGTLWVGAYRGAELRSVRVDIIPDKSSGLAPAIREHLPSRIPGKITILAREGKIEILPDRRSMVLNLRAVEVLIPEEVRGGSSGIDTFHQKFSVTDTVRIPLSFVPKTPNSKDRSTADLLAYVKELEQKLGRPGPAPAPAATIQPASFKEEEDDEDSAGDPDEPIRRRIAAGWTEFHRRQAFAISCLTFPLLGVSLSLLLDRYSRLVPFFFGNLSVIGVFFPLLMVGSILGDRGVLPAISLSLPNVALLVLGVFLSRKVVRR